MGYERSVLTRIGPIESKPTIYQTVTDPKLEPKNVLIRIRACGVCRSNLHMVEGEFKEFGVPSKLPIIPGHEVTGVVEELGEDVEGFEVGQRVGVQVLYESCRRCDMMETLRIASMGKVKVRWKSYSLSDVLIKLKRDEIVGGAVLVP